MNHSLFADKPVIQAENICFSYNKGLVPVVDRLSLQVPEGASFGLLGQNGAGKSTTLKLITGLLHPDVGEVRLFGSNLATTDSSLYKNMGVLIEYPPLYPHLSGYDNLKVTCLYRGIAASRIGVVLEMVGLHKAASRRISGYSTGMKQRLGVALALLPDPQLLILDEPINGMDPQGIVAMRTLMQELSRQHKTVMLSSHLLHEVALTCDHVGIMQEGKLLYQGSVAQLKKQYTSRQDVLMDTSDNAKARQLFGTMVSKEDTSGLWLQVDGRSQISHCIDQLREAGVSVYQVTPQEDSLEKLYLRLTQNKDENTIPMHTGRDAES